MSRPRLRARRYPGVALLILLGFLTAFFAGAAQGLVDRQLTGSLQQTLDAAGSVAGTATAQGGAVAGPSALDKTLDTFADGAPAQTLPETGQAWAAAKLVKRLGIRTAANAVTFNLEYRDGLNAHMRLVSGSLPVTAGTVDGREIFEVALTAANAKFLDVHVGSVIHSATVDFHVTGIVEPTDPSSAFWNYDPDLTAPDPQLQPDGTTLWWSAALIGPQEMNDLADVQNADGSFDYPASVYCVPLDTGGYRAKDTGSLLNAMTAFASGTVATELHLQITAGPAQTMAGFQTQRSAVDSILSLIMVGVATVGAATVLLCARLVIGRRRTHLALLRARGLSLPQLARQVLVDLAPLTVPALAAAAILAVAASDGTDPQSVFLFGAACLVVLLGPPLVAVLEHRGAARTRTEAADSVRRRPRGRRRVFELVLGLLAVGAVVVLRQRGLGGTNPGSNTLGALAPILVAAVATAVAVRCYPLLLAPAARAAQRRDGATAFLGFTGAARSALGLALPTFAIVLALTLAALGGLAYQNIESGRSEEAWLQTGTDVSIALSTGTDPAQAAKAVAALEKVPGVTHATAVAELDFSGANAAIYSVDPSSYTDVAADSPWPFADALPAQRVAGDVPVVVSADSGYAVGSVFKLIPGAAPTFEVRVVGVQAQSPARPAYGPGEPFILVPAWATAAYPDYWLVSEILVSGNGIAAAEVNAALAATVPGANHVLYRTEALDELEHQPLEGLAEFGYVLGLGAAACFGICAILLALALTAAARARRLTLLGTLGLSPRQARAIALAETAPLAASTALGGLLATLALPAVFGSALNLTVFTGLASESGLRLDLAAPLLTVAAALGLTGCGVLLQAAIARRRNVPAQLRMGEDG
ncbi:hypothetical protein KDL01_25430 [Actinospica durhamensis]|uniref:FtsX-like permease family protein n=1 Tax=Actinospica durhamensis TaxID=1508375 RepID=A0A941EUI9_9ACTN|nr:hypothetical protein [Actinospica durhamensis]MBR7836647.1 hypothetical protein [Actinospica durhamensis]